MIGTIRQIWRKLTGYGKLKMDTVDAPGYQGEHTGRGKLGGCSCFYRESGPTIVLPVDVVVVTDSVDYDAIYQARRAMESVLAFWLDSFGIAVLPHVVGWGEGTYGEPRHLHYYAVRGRTPSLYVYSDLARVGADYLGEAYIQDGYATVTGDGQSDEGLMLIINHELYHLVARDPNHYSSTFVSTRINPDHTAYLQEQRETVRAGAAKLGGVNVH